MAQVSFQGSPVNTVGSLPAVGSIAPDFSLVKQDLSTITLSELKGQKVVLNIFPSIDTGVCATSVRKFNEKAGAKEGVSVLCISRDLPFAAGRFCGAEGIDKVITASEFKDQEFSKAYGVLVKDSALAGLHARAVVVVDEAGKVSYTQLVSEITDEPNYDAALAAL